MSIAHVQNYFIARLLIILIITGAELNHTFSRSCLEICMWNSTIDVVFIIGGLSPAVEAIVPLKSIIMHTKCPLRFNLVVDEVSMAFLTNFFEGKCQHEQVRFASSVLVRPYQTFAAKLTNLPVMT